MEIQAQEHKLPLPGSYIGIPFKDGGDGGDEGDRNGCSCYGLVRLWYSEQYGIVLPVFTGQYKDHKDTLAIHNVIARALADQWIVTPLPARGDVIITNRGRDNAHIGIVLGEEDRFLHIRLQHNVDVQHWLAIGWRNQIAGFYRHIQRA